eukprot:575103-Amorphochlora_amoeboformis.AAC.2
MTRGVLLNPFVFLFLSAPIAPIHGFWIHRGWFSSKHILSVDNERTDISHYGHQSESNQHLHLGLNTYSGVIESDGNFYSSVVLELVIPTERFDDSYRNDFSETVAQFLGVDSDDVSASLTMRTSLFQLSQGLEDITPRSRPKDKTGKAEETNKQHKPHKADQVPKADETPKATKANKENKENKPSASPTTSNSPSTSGSLVTYSPTSNGSTVSPSPNTGSSGDWDSSVGGWAAGNVSGFPFDARVDATITMPS